MVLVCNVINAGASNQNLAFSWHRDADRLVSGSSAVIDSSRFSIETRSTLSALTLHDLKANDYANYSCSVVDGHRRRTGDSAWTVLQVKGSI